MPSVSLDSATSPAAASGKPSLLHTEAVPALVVMGVSGCGKSSVGRGVADALGWALYEGDAYHAPASIDKMRAGTALTDADRVGWLDHLSGLLSAPAQADGAIGRVLTCSALRQRYRDRLRDGCPGLGFVFLQLDFDAALARVQARPGHFFSPALVADQFATLEVPQAEDGVLTLDATQPLEPLVQRAVAWSRNPIFPTHSPEERHAAR